ENGTSTDTEEVRSSHQPGDRDLNTGRHSSAHIITTIRHTIREIQIPSCFGMGMMRLLRQRTPVAILQRMRESTTHLSYLSLWGRHITLTRPHLKNLKKYTPTERSL